MRGGKCLREKSDTGSTGTGQPEDEQRWSRDRAIPVQEICGSNDTGTVQDYCSVEERGSAPDTEVADVVLCDAVSG
jgi:hypothetical protein